MIIKAINEKCKNKRAAIQYLCANMDNGIVYNDCTKLLNNQKLSKDATGKNIVYKYENIDGTQRCAIERSKVEGSFIYTVSVCISLNIN